MRLIALTLALGLLIVACGGGDGERVLQLGSGDLTEEEFRSTLRLNIAKDLSSFRTLCGSLTGLTDREAFDVMRDQQPETDPDSLIQPALATDEELAASIVKQECARIE